MKLAKWFLAGFLSIAVTLAPYVPVAVVVPVAVSQAGCNTAWIQTALNDLPVLIQIAIQILSIVGAAQGKGQLDPALAAQIQSVGAQVQTDLQTLQNLVNSYQAADATAKPGILNQVKVLLGTVQSNLQAMLVAFHVTNQALQNTVSTVLAIAMTTVLSIQTLLPASASPRTLRAGAGGQVKPMTAHQLKVAFNSVVTTNGYGQYALQ
jgi:hypothetical protein